MLWEAWQGSFCRDSFSFPTVEEDEGSFPHKGVGGWGSAPRAEAAPGGSLHYTGALLKLAGMGERVPLVKALYEAVDHHWWVLYELCVGFI